MTKARAGRKQEEEKCQEIQAIDCNVSKFLIFDLTNSAGMGVSAVSRKKTMAKA